MTRNLSFGKIVGRVQQFIIDAIENYMSPAERYCEVTYSFSENLNYAYHGL
jgi:hypothetical protein